MFGVFLLIGVVSVSARAFFKRTVGRFSVRVEGKMQAPHLAYGVLFVEPEYKITFFGFRRVSPLKFWMSLLEKVSVGGFGGEHGFPPRCPAGAIYNF